MSLTDYISPSVGQVVLGGCRDLEQSIQFMGPSPLPNLPDVDVSKLPANMGVKEWLRIEDQKRQGACDGVSRTTCKEVAYYHQTGKVIQLSAEFAYLTAQRIDNQGIGDNGASIQGGVKAAIQFGTCLDSTFPYTGIYPDGGWNVLTKEMYDEAAKYKLTTAVPLSSYQMCLRWLAAKLGAIQIGILWTPECEPDNRGLVTQYQGYGKSGHAVTYADWNMDFKQSGYPYLKLPNSWSREWGIDGWAYHSPQVVDTICKTQLAVGYSTLALSEVIQKLYDWDKNPWNA